MKVLAFVASAAALDVIHANNDRVLAAVHHGGFHRVGVAAVVLPACAVSSLELSTHLERGRYTFGTKISEGSET